MIAAADSLAVFGPSDRDRISRQRGVDLKRYYPEQRLGLYQQVLDARLSTGDLDANDRSVLAHIADTLALAGADLRSAHERAFGLAVTDALEDGRLCVEERLLLYKLQHALKLDPQLAEGAYAVLAKDRLLRPVAHALSDGLLSPDEEKAILETAADLDVEVTAEIETMLDGARARWQAQNGERPEPKAEVGLAGTEGVRFQAAAWWRYAHASKLTSWAGYAAVQAGKTEMLIVPPSVLKGSKRDGVAVVTDRRLVLQAERAIPDTLALDNVEQTLRFRNGAVIRLAGGRRYFIDAGEHRDDLYRHLYYAVEDVRHSVPVSPEPASRSDDDLPPRRDPGGLVFRFDDVRWRKVLTAEVAQADHGWFGSAQASTVVKRLGGAWPSAWERKNIGHVTVDTERLTFRRTSGGTPWHTSLRTIEAIHRRGTDVWIQRRHAHDWLLRCALDEAAERLTQALSWNVGT
ncbi:hypothetical protein [Rubrivirga sp.]|uniref:hypothetical protein n=1 Tax=Rubrivirga sp. TaxID=1885344 RepID=UPI003C711AB8